MRNTVDETILNFLAGSLLLALLGLALVGQVGHEPGVQPDVAASRQAAVATPGPGFAAAFGRGAALRNLVF